MPGRSQLTFTAGLRGFGGLRAFARRCAAQAARGVLFLASDARVDLETAGAVHGAPQQADCKSSLSCLAERRYPRIHHHTHARPGADRRSWAAFPREFCEAGRGYGWWEALLGWLLLAVIRYATIVRLGGVTSRKQSSVRFLRVSESRTYGEVNNCTIGGGVSVGWMDQ